MSASTTTTTTTTPPPPTPMVTAETEEVANSLKSKAHEFYAEKNFEQAEQAFTEAINYSPTDSSLYATRSAVYCWLKKFDAALGDADKAIELNPSWAKPYCRRAAALVSMKRFAEARESYLKWQQLEPNSVDVKRALTELENIEKLEAKRNSLSMLEDFECPLCLKLFYEPVTTPCGHSFCKSCLLRALDHGAGCPICRTVMHFSSHPPISITIQNLMNNIFPNELQLRRQEKLSENSQSETCLPLFLLNVVAFPNQKLSLHIFEPRYRLMLRRCLEGDQVFGLVNCRKEGQVWQPYHIGCTLRITEVKHLSDGRSHVNAIAERRFQILEKWDQDGYMCGKVQWYDDLPVPAEEKELLNSTTESLMLMTKNLMPKANSCSGVAELLTRAGPMPSEAVDFSFWLVAVLPLSAKTKQDLLEQNSTLARMKVLEKVLTCTETSCYVQ